jgi:hypothetical protein
MLKETALGTIIEKTIDLKTGEGFNFCEDKEENNWRRIEKQNYYDNIIVLIGGYQMEMSLMDITNEMEDEISDTIAVCITYYFEQHNIPKQVYVEINKDKEIEALWNEFGDIPMNPETEEIEQDWNGFTAGTNREDIWHWFDERHSKGVGWLMNDYERR